jgi:protein arginine N-methyltransferase 1
LWCCEQVIGIDQASIVSKTREIVASNGYSDIVEILEGKLEHIELPVAKVDIIISEWMGYFLHFESMLSTVLNARDRWLAEVCAYNVHLGAS